MISDFLVFNFQFLTTSHHTLHQIEIIITVTTIIERASYTKEIKIEDKNRNKNRNKKKDRIKTEIKIKIKVKIKYDAEKKYCDQM